MAQNWGLRKGKFEVSKDPQEPRDLGVRLQPGLRPGTSVWRERERGGPWDSTDPCPDLGVCLLCRPGCPETELCSVGFHLLEALGPGPGEP